MLPLCLWRHSRWVRMVRSTTDAVVVLEFGTARLVVPAPAAHSETWCDPSWMGFYQSACERSLQTADVAFPAAPRSNAIPHEGALIVNAAGPDEPTVPALGPRPDDHGRESRPLQSKARCRQHLAHRLG